jgi:alkylation response protein AidB-like acyl-CoA dehydrogenase
MGFLLTEDQQQIRQTARDFVQRRLPVGHLRRLRDTADPEGFSREAWRELAALGMAGIPVAAEHGGGGLGYTELGLVLEECGRTLAPTPFLSTVVLGAGALGPEHGDLLRGICSGEQIMAFAHEEGRRHAPYEIATRAQDDSLSGEKTFVLDGHVADAFVVVARAGGDLTLHLVPARAPGVTVERTVMVDSRNAARVRFDGARGERIGGADLLDRLLDRARIALAAEMLGGLQEAFDRTIAYLKVRKQFDVPIGSFQALKHRAAQMYCEVELCRSIVADALRAIDEERPDLPALASVAKARASDAFLHITAEAIQMHGGVGVTDELDIGFFYKRARVAELTFGDAAFHRDRFARLRGY